MNDESTTSEPIPAETIDTIENIRLKLLECKTKKAIEAVFSEFSIDDYIAKTDFLHSAMQMEMYGLTNVNDKSTPKDFYEYYVKVYLNEEWKDFV